MKKYKKIKNIFRGLLASATVLSSGPVVSQIIITNKLEGEGYKTAQQIDSDAEIFDSTSNLKPKQKVSNQLRLKHNDGRPIWVHIDDSINESDEKIIKQTLKYYEDIFKDINDKYHFEIVNSATYKFRYIMGDTTIKYQSKPSLPSQASGLNESKSLYANHNYIKSSTITINSNMTQDAALRYYVFLHELSHTFGLKDVYYHGSQANTDTYYGNTITQSSPLQWSIGKITPEDYKYFHALYNKSHYEKDKVVPALLENTLNNIKEYESNYYNYVIEKMMQSMTEKNYSTNFEKIIDDQTEQLELIYKNTRNENNEFKQYKNKITLENGHYFWQAYKNEELYHETDGSYLEQGNLIVIPTLKIFAPSFSVSKHGNVTDMAVVSVILMKQEGKHFLIPIDTLTKHNLQANVTLKNELDEQNNKKPVYISLNNENTALNEYNYNFAIPSTAQYHILNDFEQSI